MRRILAPALCLFMAACATVEPAPVARPLSQASIEAMGPTKLSVNGTEQGVGKAWYFTSVDGSGAGLAGVIAGAIVTAVINAAPSARAHRQADEVAEVEPVEVLNASLVDTVKQEAAKQTAGVTFPEVALAYRSVTPEPLDDAVEISTAYLLSEDSSVMKIVAVASYSNAAMPYKTPYTFTKSVPKEETKGPLYRNVFTYYSDPLPVPVLTPELRERLIANIRESALDANGAPPAEGTSEYKSMMREIEQANDDKLTPTETSLFLTREWLSNDGERIKTEIARAHDFIARYVMLDINRTDIPSLTGEDELLETAADERTVRRIGKDAAAGSYVSSAAGVTDFATYGNAVAVSKRNVAYVKELKEQAKPAKAGKKS